MLYNFFFVKQHPNRDGILYFSSWKMSRVGFLHYYFYEISSAKPYSVQPLSVSERTHTRDFSNLRARILRAPILAWVPTIAKTFYFSEFTFNARVFFDSE